MRGLLSWSVVAVTVCVLATGCGNGKLQTRGRVVKGGQPLLPHEEESVRVTFVPILPDGKPPSDHYFAEFDRDDGTFWACGKDKEGLPPGKYRVAVENKKRGAMPWAVSLTRTVRPSYSRSIPGHPNS